MAPRGGRGGGFHASGEGGGSNIQCNGADFSDPTVIVYFAESVLFFVIFGLILLLALSFGKKCRTGKKLIGAPYIISLLFTTLGFLLNFIATILQQCGTANSDTYLSLIIASTVFFNLGWWFLLFVYIYFLNIMLRERYGGSALIYKAVCLVIVGVLFALFCGLIGVQSYDIWAAGDGLGDSGLAPLYHQEYQLATALNVLVLIAVLAAGGLSLMTLMSLRSRQHPASGLIIWVCFLFFCMLWPSVISIVFSASTLESLSSDYYTQPLTLVTQEALAYIENFWQAVASIILLLIAKHVGWDSSAATPTSAYVPPAQAQQTQYVAAPQQQQYAYNQPHVQQQQHQQSYYQQQGPVYNNGPGYVK